MRTLSLLSAEGWEVGLGGLTCLQPGLPRAPCSWPPRAHPPGCSAPPAAAVSSCLSCPFRPRAGARTAPKLCSFLLGRPCGAPAKSLRALFFSRLRSQGLTHSECPVHKSKATVPGCSGPGQRGQGAAAWGGGWAAAGQACWAGDRTRGKALPGPPLGPPPFPPPKGKERLINQLLWATKQNKSH